MATFVLVSGSYHGWWCWKKVTPLLTNHDHRVYAPTLTGLGERSHLLREDIDLNTHILDIIQVFEYEDLDDVILVGHFKKRSLSSQGKEWLVQPLDPAVWGVTDIDDIAWIKRHLSPMPWHTHDQPIRINNPEAKKIPKSYISCTEYSTEYKALQFMAQKAKLQLGWDYHELKSGHLANVTVPNELVQILETLI